MIDRDYSYICEQKQKMSQLSHASNIISKWGNNVTRQQKKALEHLIPEYAKYIREMLAISDNHCLTEKEKVNMQVACVNRYYNYMHNNNFENTFSAQGKFRPTILEEFLFLLFRAYVIKVKENHDIEDVLGSGAVKAYTNIYFKAKNFKDFIVSPEIGVNEKDQDYAIYRTFDISINNANPLKIRIPAVAIEAKTYIDKTMLDSIIATAEKIKSGNPHTRFIAVSERYDVSFGVDPAYSRIDQIYILRKGMKKQEWAEIDAEVVWRLYDETINHLNRPWSDIETRINEEGVII